MTIDLRRSLRRSIRALFDHAGVRVGFDHPVRNGPKLFVVKAKELGVRTVLDIGANKGQFAGELRKYGYDGMMVSFEPLTAAHCVLVKDARRDPRWQVAPRMALGDVPGDTEINISQNLSSSSLLQVTGRSVQSAAGSEFAGKELVSVCRLDDIRTPSWHTPLALKLDTQGFEMHVLRGASETLAETRLILTEMSLVPLYASGATFVDVYAFLDSLGFRCISLVQGFVDNVGHELLQVDGVFVR